MDLEKLKMTYVYVKQPKLVSSSGIWDIPIFVETIEHAKNVAGVIVNGQYVLSYEWTNKLLESLEKQNE